MISLVALTRPPYDAKVGRYGDGTIYNLGGLGGTINRDLFSEQYDPPFAIGFSNIPANVFAQGTMALKGYRVGSEPSPDYSRSPPDWIEASGIGRVDGGFRGGFSECVGG